MNEETKIQNIRISFNERNFSFMIKNKRVVKKYKMSGIFNLFISKTSQALGLDDSNTAQNS